MHSRCGELNSERGASLVEFSIIGLSVVLVGLFTLQIGLLYHAKTTLNYAVFEAARAGSVNHASMSAMRTELGMRLAPLEGGDGSRDKALSAVAWSSLNVLDPVNTRMVILNPTRAAFRDWAIQDADTGKRFIPVNHLRHQQYKVGQYSGLSLRDATLLKLQVTHGVTLRVPVVGKLMTAAMIKLDPGNALFYLAGKWPLQSVAIVRMQSDALEDEVAKSAGLSDSGETGPAVGRGWGDSGDISNGESADSDPEHLAGDPTQSGVGDADDGLDTTASDHHSSSVSEDALDVADASEDSPEPGMKTEETVALADDPIDFGAESENDTGQNSGPLADPGTGQQPPHTALPCEPVLAGVERLVRHDSERGGALDHPGLSTSGKTLHGLVVNKTLSGWAGKNNLSDQLTLARTSEFRAWLAQTD